MIVKTSAIDTTSPQATACPAVQPQQGAKKLISLTGLSVFPKYFRENLKQNLV
jgi:hypothetical protein